jgi:glutathione S-transferase
MPTLGGTIPGQLPFSGVGMNKSEFLAILRTERAKLERLLAAVGISRMDVAGVSGFYSTKDIVAHLAAYDRALVKWLKEARAGRVYMDNVLDQPDLNARNAVVYEINKDRGAADVVEIFRQTLDELEACVEFLTDEELTKADLTAWFVAPRWQRKQELWQCIANDSYEHQQQHIPDIDRWLAEHGSIGSSA